MYKPIYENDGKDKAVSPIIATILIVAITVVLAATLYAVISGYGGLIGKSTPTAGITVTTSANKATVSVTSVSGNLSFSDVKLSINGGAGISLKGTFASGALSVNSGTTPITYYVNITGSEGGYMSGLTTIVVWHSGGAITSLKLVDTSTSGTVFNWPS